MRPKPKSGGGVPHRRCRAASPGSRSSSSSFASGLPAEVEWVDRPAPRPFCASLIVQDNPTGSKEPFVQRKPRNTGGQHQTRSLQERPVPLGRGPAARRLLRSTWPPVVLGPRGRGNHQIAHCWTDPIAPVRRSLKSTPFEQFSNQSMCRGHGQPCPSTDFDKTEFATLRRERAENREYTTRDRARCRRRPRHPASRHRHHLPPQGQPPAGDPLDHGATERAPQSGHLVRMWQSARLLPDAPTRRHRQFATPGSETRTVSSNGKPPGPARPPT